MKSKQLLRIDLYLFLFRTTKYMTINTIMYTIKKTYQGGRGSFEKNGIKR